MDRRTREFVRHRAGNRCEYCGLPQELSPVAQLQIEHIIPRKHGGSDQDYNLAMACIDCNLAKSSKLTGIDPQPARPCRFSIRARSDGTTISPGKTRFLSDRLQLAEQPSAC